MGTVAEGANLPVQTSQPSISGIHQIQDNHIRGLTFVIPLSPSSPELAMEASSPCVLSISSEFGHGWIVVDCKKLKLIISPNLFCIFIIKRNDMPLQTLNKNVKTKGNNGI